MEPGKNKYVSLNTLPALLSFKKNWGSVGKEEQGEMGCHKLEMSAAGSTWVTSTQIKTDNSGTRKSVA